VPAKKAAAKKAAAKKPIARKAAAKKAPAKKAAAKKAPVKKTVAKKAAPKKPTAKKAPANKAIAKKAVSKPVAKAKPASRSKAKAKAAPKKTMLEPTLLERVLKSLDDDKAEDIVTIDLEGRSSLTDALVIASGRSSRHVASLAEHLARKLKDAGYGTRPIDGLPQGDWVLVDAGDVIVHLFRPEVREYYDLEGMWSVPEPETGPEQDAKHAAQ
jgi:ribosome-associated protein